MKIDNAFFLIGRIRERYKAFLELEMRNRGMTGLVTSHADILVALTFCGELTLSEVAEKIHRDRSTVTTLVAKLVKLGYVSQRKSEEDNRSSFLSLTERGKAVIPEMQPITKLLFAKATAGISGEEWASFRTTLEKIYANFKEA